MFSLLYKKGNIFKIFSCLFFAFIIIGGYQNCDQKELQKTNPKLVGGGPAPIERDNGLIQGDLTYQGELQDEQAQIVICKGEPERQKFCVIKYDSEGCNLCALQSDNVWLCTMKHCIAETEERQEELDNRANQCLLYYKGNGFDDNYNLANMNCTEKYDSEGCNLCTLQSDNTWFCRKKHCIAETEEQKEELKWRSNLCVGYAPEAIPVYSDPHDPVEVIEVPSESSPGYDPIEGTPTEELPPPQSGGPADEDIRVPTDPGNL